jgi:hypothetical protein
MLLYTTYRLTESLVTIVCQNLGASNRTPVQQQTRLETLWTGVKECRKRVVRETT